MGEDEDSFARESEKQTDPASQAPPLPRRQFCTRHEMRWTFMKFEPRACPGGTPPITRILSPELTRFRVRTVPSALLIKPSKLSAIPSTKRGLIPQCRFNAW